MGLLVVMGAGSVMTNLRAQPGNGGGGSNVRSVPMSECDCEPPDMQGACIGDYSAGSCVRIDGPPVKTKSGILSTVSQEGECINCVGCMENPPPPLTCQTAASVSFTQSLTVSVDVGISVGDDAIKASFSHSVGAGVAAGATVTAACSTTAPPCKVVVVRASIDVEVGAEYEIQHRWLATGTWVSEWWGTCDFEGQSFTDECGTGKSVAVASIAGNSRCETIGYYDCVR